MVRHCGLGHLEGQQTSSEYQTRGFVSRNLAASETEAEMVSGNLSNWINTMMVVISV